MEKAYKLHGDAYAERKIENMEDDGKEELEMSQHREFHETA